MRHITFLLLLILLFPACKKSHKTSSTSYSHRGTIMGPSLFMTACGAKYWIKITDTAAGRTTFDSVPAGCGIDPSAYNAADTLNVKLNFHYGIPENCAIIIIDEIERAD